MYGNDLERRFGAELSMPAADYGTGPDIDSFNLLIAAYGRLTNRYYGQYLSVGSAIANVITMPVLQIGCRLFNIPKDIAGTIFAGAKRSELCCADSCMRPGAAIG